MARSLVIPLRSQGRMARSMASGVARTAALLLCLPAVTAYTLLGAHHGRSLRAGGCFAAETRPQGGNALQGPQGGGPPISARALDQLIEADPEKKKNVLKGLKRGK